MAARVGASPESLALTEPVAEPEPCHATPEASSRGSHVSTVIGQRTEGFAWPSDAREGRNSGSGRSSALQADSGAAQRAQGSNRSAAVLPARSPRIANAIAARARAQALLESDSAAGSHGGGSRATAAVSSPASEPEGGGESPVPSGADFEVAHHPSQGGDASPTASSASRTAPRQPSQGGDVSPAPSGADREAGHRLSRVSSQASSAAPRDSSGHPPRRRRLHCKRRCSNNENIIVDVLPVSAFFVFALLTWLWYSKAPSVSEGAFGMAHQVSLSGVIQRIRFQQAKRFAAATPSMPGSGAGGAEDPFADHVWRRVVLAYHSNNRSVVSDRGLEQVQRLEQRVRDLPTWQRLCWMVPLELQRMCKPGDSLVAAIYGSQNGPTAEQEAQGLQKEIIFDGLGTYTAMAPEKLLELLESTAPAALWWRLPQDRGKRLEALRSTFAFYLPRQVVELEWHAFVRDELGPLLLELAWSAEGKAGGLTEDGTVRLFYTFDGEEELGMHSREFEVAFDREFKFVASALVLAPLSAALAVLAITRRLFLALSASAIVFAAPAVASLLLVDQGGDGMTRVPAVGIAAWAAVTAGSVDCAVGCAAAMGMILNRRRRWRSSLSILASEMLQGKPLKEARMPLWLRAWFLQGRWRKQIYRSLAACGAQAAALVSSLAWAPRCYERSGPFLVLVGEALGPVLLSGLILWNLPYDDRVVMVGEFARHAGLGLILVAAFSGLLCPGVIQFGDMLKHHLSGGLFSQPILSILYDNAMPLELGADPKWRQQLHNRVTFFLERQIGTVTTRLFALLLVGGTIAGVRVVGGPSRWDAETPRLFAKGHRIQDAPEVWALFGPLPGPLDMLAEAPRSMKVCEADAAHASCQLHTCEAGEDLGAGQCSCVYDPTPSNASCSGAAARIWGLEAQTERLNPDAFWQWASESFQQIGIDIHRGASSLQPAAQEIGELDLLDWSSGLSWFERGRGTALLAGEDASGGPLEATAWQAACARTVCFCGGQQCESAWSPLGSARKDEIVDLINATEASSEARIRPSDRLELIWNWGLDTSAPMPPRSFGIDSSVTFSGEPALQSLTEQRRMFSFCAGTPPDLQVASKDCWVLGFKRWVDATHDIPYPVKEEDFHHSFLQFSRELASDVPLQNRDVRFWLGEDGRIRAFSSSFTINSTSDQAADAELVSKWREYAELRGFDVGNLMIQGLEDEDGSDVVREVCVTAAKQAMILAGLGTLLATQSLGLALALSLSLACALGIFAILAVMLLGWRDVGVLEIVAMEACLTGVTVPLLRVVQFYYACQEVPAKRASQRSEEGSSGGWWPRWGQKQTSPARSAGQVAAEPKKSTFMSGKTAFRARSKSVYAPRRDVATTAAASRRPEESLFHVPLWVGGCEAEREARGASAICCGAEVIFGSTLATVLAGSLLTLTSMEGLGKVGLAILVAAAVSVPVALLLLPEILVSLRLGPSRVARRALVVFFVWLWRKGPGVPVRKKESLGGVHGWWRSDEVTLMQIQGRYIRRDNVDVGVIKADCCDSVSAEIDGAAIKASLVDNKLYWDNGEVWTRAEDVDKSTEEMGMLAARVLGFPYTLALAETKGTCCSWLSREAVGPSRRKNTLSSRTSQGRREDAIADALALQGVLTLHLPHGATAMPPNHMVVTVPRDLSMKG